MEERTLKIISICKGMSKIPKKSEQYNNILDSIVDYMADECNCPIEEYDEDILLQIIQNAAYDFIRTCDYPHTFLRSFFEALRNTKKHKFVRSKIPTINHKYDSKELAEALCTALAQVRVMKNGKYINGFHENDLKPVYSYKDEIVMKPTIKKIIFDTVDNLKEIKKVITILQTENQYHLKIENPFMTDTKTLFAKIDENIKNLSTIENTILVALCAAVYAGNIEAEEKGFENEFGADSLNHRNEYLAFAEQYDLPYNDDGLIATDAVYDNVSNYMREKYAVKE